MENMCLTVTDINATYHTSNHSMGHDTSGHHIETLSDALSEPRQRMQQLLAAYLSEHLCVLQQSQSG